MTKARDIANLLSTANGKIAGSNLDVSFENISDTGTEGTKVASGTTAQRGSTTGQWRYNTTTNFFEGRNASGSFLTLEPTPTITGVDDGEIDSAGGGNQTLVITGTNFSSGGTISFIGATAQFDATTTTFNSATQVTAVAPKASFLNAQEPYKIKFASSSGLSGQSATGLISVDNNPTWTTASGALPHMWDSIRTTGVTVTANDTEGDTIAYSLVSGSLPTGASLNSSTGVISGANAVGSDTTSSFTLRATANSKTVDRAFTLTVKPPVTQTYSYTGSNQTFSVPTGLTSVTAHIWGAGGGGATNGGWTSSYYGGAGGSAVGTINTSSISSLIIIVGQGGEGNDDNATTTIRNSFGGGGGNNNSSDGQYSGGGGGLSGIFNGSYSHANSLLIAGGGGGGGNTSSSGDFRGGAGGGTTGQDGVSSGDTNKRGRGGTQSAGGVTGTDNTNSATEGSGSALQGGYNPSSGYGGNGGGGYYGGGSGSYSGSYMGGGGGGSGYQHPTLVSNGTLYAGNLITVANTSSAYYSSGIGTAGANSASNADDGGNGKVVIVY